MQSKNNIAVYSKISNKRDFRRIRSNLKAKLKRGTHIPSHLKRKYNLDNSKPYEHKKINLKQPDKWLTINIPKKFCFIADQNSCFDFLKDLKDKLQTKKPKNLYFIHSETDLIGLSASHIFDSSIKEYVNRWLKKNVDIVLRGETGDNKTVNNFLLSFGLLSSINLEGPFPRGFVDQDYKNKYETFKFEGSDKKDFLKGNASTRLADYFRKCYKYNNYYLSDEVHSSLADSFGEIICNAEEHSSENGQNVYWNVLGCYNKNTSYCSFSIINYGKTIYQSLSDKTSTSAEVIKAVNSIINSNKSYFNKTKEKLFTTSHEEPIWNVMALQDGISSKRTLGGRASTRGQGIMDVLEFIQSLKSHDDSAKIVVISGKSKILIDFEFPIVQVSVGNENELRRQIVFNKERSLHKPQDVDKMILMPNSFDGTIITGRFKINESSMNSWNRLKGEKNASS